MQFRIEFHLGNGILIKLYFLFFLSSSSSKRTVCNRDDIVTKSMIDQFVKVWQLKAFTLFVQPPTTISQSDKIELHDNQSKMVSDASAVAVATATTATTEAERKPKSFDSSNYLFSLILSPVNVFAQQLKPRNSFEKLANIITMLIKNRLMSLAFLNEQCMQLLHMEWHQVSFSLIFWFSCFKCRIN